MAQDAKTVLFDGASWGDLDTEEQAAMGGVLGLEIRTVERPSASNETAETAAGLAEMRAVKSGGEQALMARAAHLSAVAMQQEAQVAAEGLRKGAMVIEGTLVGGFLQRVRSLGCEGVAYDSIVASGERGTTLHYVRNDQRIVAGDMVLMDAGAKFGGYSADLTRTWPAGGVYSAAQRAVYGAVLGANEAAIAAVKAGVTLKELQSTATDALVQGMLEAGIGGAVSREDLAAMVTRERVFPHSIGHHLGLQVHDATPEAAELRDGNVITIEPGLYFHSDAFGSEFAGLAVRIEDDVLVGREGGTVFTAGMPKTVSAVEAMLAPV